jgi:hypothetical protein
MLPIPLFIDNYNHHMNGADLADQLRAVYCTQQPSIRNWHPYFYYFLDTAICNSYLLWRWNREARYPSQGDRQSERLNSYRYYRETLVEALMEGIPVKYDHIVIRAKHEFIAPKTRIATKFHVSTGGAKRTRCYFCRYKVFKRICTLGQGSFHTTCRCAHCDVPLCYRCFKPYHEYAPPPAEALA